MRIFAANYVELCLNKESVPCPYQWQIGQKQIGQIAFFMFQGGFKL